MTNPDTRAVGVQIATTLSCHGCRRSAGSVAVVAASGAASAVTAPISALAAVSSRAASWPATMVTICVHSYHLPSNATGLSDSTMYEPGRRLTDVVPSSPVTVRRGTVVGGIVADEQRVPRHGGHVTLGIEQSDRDVKHAERLTVGHAREDSAERRESKRAQHGVDRGLSTSRCQRRAMSSTAGRLFDRLTGSCEGMAHRRFRSTYTL